MPAFTAYFNTNQSWNNTGYTYTAGTELFIYAFGAHADNPNNDNWVETPAGHSHIPTSGHPLNGVPENGLIGKIGTSGTPFYIGAGGKMVLSDNESGDLYLEVNDGDISNNVGELFIHIFDLSTLSIGENTNPNFTISTYPNPVLNSLTVVLPNPLKEKYTINIINLNGQTVFNTNYNTEHLKIDLSKLLSGQYVISVLDSKGKILGVKKVVKE